MTDRTDEPSAAAHETAREPYSANTEQVIAELSSRAEALEKERDEAREAVADWEADRNEWGRQVHDQIDRATKAEAEVAALKAKADGLELALDAVVEWDSVCGDALPNSLAKQIREALAELTQEGGNV